MHTVSPVQSRYRVGFHSQKMHLLGWQDLGGAVRLKNPRKESKAPNTEAHTRPVSSMPAETDPRETGLGG